MSRSYSSFKQFISTTFHGGIKAKFSHVKITCDSGSSFVGDLVSDVSTASAEITLLCDGDNRFHSHCEEKITEDQKYLFTNSNVEDALTNRVKSIGKQVLILLPQTSTHLTGKLLRIPESWWMKKSASDRTSYEVLDHLLVRLKNSNAAPGHSGAAVVLKDTGICIGMLRGGTEDGQVVLCISTVAQAKLLAEQGWRCKVCGCLERMYTPPPPSSSTLRDRLTSTITGVFGTSPQQELALENAQILLRNTQSKKKKK